MNKALTGLVVARRAHEARRCGELMAFRLCVAPAGCDLVAHASPFFEPRGVVAYATFERTADTMHLVDFDACPRRSAKTNEQAHGPAVIGRKIKEGGVVFAPEHFSLLSRRPAAPAPALHPPRSTDDWLSASSGGGEGAPALVSPRLFAEDSPPPHQPSLVRAEVRARMQRAPIVPH